MTWLKMLYYSKYKTKLYGYHAPSIFKKMVQLSLYLYGCWSNYSVPPFHCECSEISGLRLQRFAQLACLSCFLLFSFGSHFEGYLFLCSCTSLSLDSNKISSFTVESILWVVHQNPLCIPDWLKNNYRNMEQHKREHQFYSH